MSVDAFVDFGIRLAGETAIDVIQLVGSDDTRAAAATRALVFFGTATVCALGIWFLLPMMVSGQASIFAVACFVVIIGIGGYVTRRAFGEVWRLVHWGEPGVIADKAELTISKHKKTIA